MPGEDSQKGNLSISIEDTGIGFDPDRQEALFSPFTQADGSVTRSFGGTGLGLAITRSLIQLMGGDVSANGRPGVGATFVATLPVRMAQPSMVITEASNGLMPMVGDRSGNGEQRVLSVLLVEDHEINRKLAEIMLQRMGFSYALANHGQQALDILAQQRFDVVLMDVMMPVMDGITALRLLREQESLGRPRTPVLMVTAHAMTGDKERFMSEGADGYVSKPMSQLALHKEIMRVVGRLSDTQQDGQGEE